MGSRRICHEGISRTYQLVRPFMGLTVYENVLVGFYFGKTGREKTGTIENEGTELLRLTGLLQKANVPAKN